MLLFLYYTDYTAVKKRLFGISGRKCGTGAFQLIFTVPGSELISQDHQGNHRVPGGIGDQNGKEVLGAGENRLNEARKNPGSLIK